MTETWLIHHTAVFNGVNRQFAYNKLYISNVLLFKFVILSTICTLSSMFHSFSRLIKYIMTLSWVSEYQLILVGVGGRRNYIKTNEKRNKYILDIFFFFFVHFKSLKYEIWFRERENFGKIISRGVLHLLKFNLRYDLQNRIRQRLYALNIFTVLYF